MSRANIQTGRARAAVTDLRRVFWQIKRGENRAQKEPIAQIARQKIGVLALPAQTSCLGQGFFHHRSRIDKNLDLGRCLPDDPTAQPLKPPLDQIVIIAPLRIGGDGRQIAVF